MIDNTLALRQAFPRMADRHVLALGALRHFAIGKDYCWPGLAKIAGILCRGRGAISRVLHECESLGYIVIEQRVIEGTRQHRSNVYRFTEKIWAVFQRALSSPRSTPPRSPRPVERPAPRPARTCSEIESRDSPSNHVGREERNDRDSDRSESATARASVGEVVSNAMAKLGAFARRRRAPGADMADPEVRRQRRMQILMSEVGHRLSPDEREAYWLIFTDADLPTQRRAMDRLELLMERDT